MPVRLWRIASDTPDWEADDLRGKGAEAHGGRWNRRGHPAVYTSGSIALAVLETIVHLDDADLPLNRFLVAVDVPDEIWARRLVHELASLPVGWTARPAGRVSIEIGQAWLSAGSAAIMQVPSVVVPEEFNVVIDPRHADARHVKAHKLRGWDFDARMWR